MQMEISFNESMLFPPFTELAVLLRVGTVQPAVRADLSGRMLLRTACFSPLVVRSADQQWRRTGLQGHQGGEATGEWRFRGTMNQNGEIYDTLDQTLEWKFSNPDFRGNWKSLSIEQ